MKLFKKLLFILLAFTVFSSAFTPFALAQEAAPPEDVIVVVEELNYDPVPALIGMRDAEEILIRMAGVLDRYDGTGHPDDCQDFTTYSIFLSLFEFSFQLEAIFAPNEWNDVLTLAGDATTDALKATEPILLLCNNGNDDSLSAFNLAAGRDGIAKALEKLRSAIRATAERIGVDPATVPSSIVDIIDAELSPEDIAFISDLLGFPEWDAELFYEDVKITQAFNQEIAGWEDRLLAGETVGCGEYVILFSLALNPVPFLSVPAEWQPMVDEHTNILRSMLDSNHELLDVCINGGNINEFMVTKARSGMAKAADRIHALKQETERRLGITPQ